MNDEKFTILVVDDDTETREMYADVFTTAGFTVMQAQDGVEALDMITQRLPQPPHLVFTGIIMPRMDGYALVDALKKNVATAGIPIVFSSHLGRKEDQDQARAMGVNDFVILGVTPANEVVARVKAMLTGGEYNLALNPSGLDASRLAADLGLDPATLCPPGLEGTAVLKLRLRDAERKLFDAELTCV